MKPMYRWINLRAIYMNNKIIWYLCVIKDTRNMEQQIHFGDEKDYIEKLALSCQ